MLTVLALCVTASASASSRRRGSPTRARTPTPRTCRRRKARRARRATPSDGRRGPRCHRGRAWRAATHRPPSRSTYSVGGAWVRQQLHPAAHDACQSSAKCLPFFISFYPSLPLPSTFFHDINAKVMLFCCQKQWVVSRYPIYLQRNAKIYKLSRVFCRTFFDVIIVT